MSETLCTLRTKGGGGGKYTETSLWTNSSPTSNFSGQDVTLSESIDNFKYIAVKFKSTTTSSSDSQMATVIYKVEDVKKATSPSAALQPVSAFGNLNSGNTNYNYRYIVYKGSTTLFIANAYSINASGSNSALAIPLEILGLNELDHGTKYTSNVEVFPLATVTGGTTPTYTTKGRAVAIWQMWGRTDNVGFGIRTNVNPTTGAINNNEIYMSQSGGMSWTIQSGASFTVTDTTITTTAISSNNRVVALAYTY